MVKSFAVFFRFYLFWMIFFFLDRLIFLVYFNSSAGAATFGEKAATFWYALRLDSSMAAYISAVPLLVYVLCLLIPRFNPGSGFLKVYVGMLIAAFAIISAFNLNIYREWGSKLNYRALDLGFNSTREAMASGSSSPVLLSLMVLLFIAISGWLISCRVIRYRVEDRGKPLSTRVSGSVLALALLVLVIRGGWQLSPINQSMAYFSTNTVLNHAAVNTEWNLIQDVINNKYGDDNPYTYYKQAEARQIVAELFVKGSEPAPKILANTRPNVVLIIVESLTAELVGALGGEPEVTPNLNALSKEGLLFTDIYAAAGRTDKGIVATLSGFPSQAIRSVMKQNDKQEKLPGLAEDLRENGYQTSFYYGGESEFFNMKSYILSHGYQRLVDQHSFSRRDMNSKWGTFDHKVFEKNLHDLDQAGQPFFSTILTLTNHEPFELPGTARYPGEDVRDKFRSTTFYTDSCIGAYLRQAQKKAWYANTIFIIMADHSHRLPGNLTEFDPKRYRIPLLFLGGALKPEYRGKRADGTASQTDLPASLLGQLGIDAGRYPWSKDIFSPQSRQFAFFNWDNGFAFAAGGQIVSFDNVGKTILMRKNAQDNSKDEQLLRYGKAYMQTVFQDYLDL